MSALMQSLIAAAGGSVAPPQFIAAASTQNGTNGTTLVINKPAGTINGDLMIAFMAGNSATTWTGDTGWTEIADQGSNSPSTRIAYKVAGSSEGASYTFTNANSGGLSGSILTYRGAAYDTIGAFALTADPLVPTGPAASANNSKLIGIAAMASANANYTAPGSMTNRVTDNDGTSPSYAIFDETVGSGATGTRSFTKGGTAAGTANTAAIMLTIKPA